MLGFVRMQWMTSWKISISLFLFLLLSPLSLSLSLSLSLIPLFFFRDRILHNPSPLFSFNFISMLRSPRFTFLFPLSRSLFFASVIASMGFYSRAHHTRRIYAAWLRIYAIFHFKYILSCRKKLNSFDGKN